MPRDVDIGIGKTGTSNDKVSNIWVKLNNDNSGNKINPGKIMYKTEGQH